VLLEHVAEMTLVVEARRQSNVGDRVVSFRQLARRPVETKPANILAYGCSIMFFEGASEVRRVHAYGICDLDEV